VNSVSFRNTVRNIINGVNNMIDTYVAFDLETTGLSPTDCYILEIGAIKINNGQVADTYETFVQCPVAIDARVTELTGITDDMVRDGKTERQAITELLEFLGDSIILGHNIPFDFGFVKATAMRNGLNYEAKAIDTLKIARKALPVIEKRSLEYLCDYYRIQTTTSHRALEDARASMELYKIFVEKFGNNKEWFEPEPMYLKVKKKEPITAAQKGYLTDLLRYHRLKLEVPMEQLTKSEASRKIDEIIRDYGKIQRSW